MHDDRKDIITSSVFFVVVVSIPIFFLWSCRAETRHTLTDWLQGKRDNNMKTKDGPNTNTNKMQFVCLHFRAVIIVRLDETNEVDKKREHIEKGKAKWEWKAKCNLSSTNINGMSVDENETKCDYHHHYGDIPLHRIGNSIAFGGHIVIKQWIRTYSFHAFHSNWNHVEKNANDDIKRYKCINRAKK